MQVGVRLSACFPLKLNTRQESSCDFHGGHAQCLADTQQRHLGYKAGYFLASWVFLSLCFAAVSHVCCVLRKGTYKVTITQLVFNNLLSCCQIVTRREV